MPSIVVDQLPGLEQHSAVLMGDSLVVFGGKTGPRSLSPHTFALSLTTQKWQRLTCGGALPAPRCMHSAVVYGWRMIVFGGLLAVGVDDIHYNTFNVFAHPDHLDDEVLKLRGKDRLYDPERLRRVTQQRRESSSIYALDMKEEASWGHTSTFGSVPPTRAGHAATIYRSTMYIFGGYSVHTTARATDEEVKACYQVYSLNLDSLTWTVVDCLESVPPMRWGMSSITVSSLWVLFGGVDVTCSREDNSVVMWDFERGEWRWVHVDLQNSEPPPCRSMHTANRFGDQMLVFGGSGDVSSMLFNDLFAFDLKQGTWSKVGTTGTPPLPRSGHTSTVVGEQLYIFGGIDHSFHRAARVWSLNLKTLEWGTVSCTYSPYDLQNVRGVGPTDDVYSLTNQKAAASSPKREPYGDIVRTALGPNPSLSQGVQTNMDAASDAISTSYAGLPAGYATHSPGWGGASQKHMVASDMTARLGNQDVPREQLEFRQPQQESDPLSPEDRTHTYPVAWSPDAEGMHSMRQNIAHTKTVLGNMVDAASARAERETYGVGPAWNTQQPPEKRNRTELQSDVARENITRELDARTLRLKDLTQTVGQSVVGNDQPATTYDTAQHYWKQELNSLGECHELFRQATQRYNAMEDVYDRIEDRSGNLPLTARKGLDMKNDPRDAVLASGTGMLAGQAGSPGSPGERGATQRMHLYSSGPTTGTQHAKMTQESTRAMFPGSATMKSNPIHDPTHPKYEGIRFSKPKETSFVSPSIAKLGLKDQLGRHRTVAQKVPVDATPTPASTPAPLHGRTVDPPQSAFSMQIPQSLRADAGFTNLGSDSGQNQQLSPMQLPTAGGGTGSGGHDLGDLSPQQSMAYSQSMMLPQRDSTMGTGAPSAGSPRRY